MNGRCCPGEGTMAHVRGCVNHPEHVPPAWACLDCRANEVSLDYAEFGAPCEKHGGNAWSKLEMEHVGGCNDRCDGDTHYLLGTDVRHEHDAGGCYECPCIAQPWSQSAPCLCNEIAAHVAAALSAHRQDWASWLAGWIGAVGPMPPTVDAVVSALRSDHLPFGVAKAKA